MVLQILYRFCQQGIGGGRGAAGEIWSSIGKDRGLFRRERSMRWILNDMLCYVDYASWAI